jgi:hypothetical protein
MKLEITASHPQVSGLLFLQESPWREGERIMFSEGVGCPVYSQGVEGSLCCRLSGSRQPWRLSFLGKAHFMLMLKLFSVVL